MIKKPSAGFTLIELVVVIAIIGILSAISIVGFSTIQQGARNTQRSSQINAIAEALEKYYMKNGEYPTCASIASPVPINTVATTVLPGLYPNVLTAPLAAAGTNSLQCANPTSPTQFAYLNGGTSYTLQYEEEGTSNIDSLSSRHHAITPNYTLTLIANNGGTVSGGGSFAAGSSPTITATPNQFYQGLSNNTAVWTGDAGCASGGNGLSHSVYMGGPITCTAHFETIPIAAPATPVVTMNTVSGTTTYTWTGTTSCSGGNTIGYQYDYTIPESSYDSGWVATASTSAAFSTWDDGHHYNLAVQAYCYNTATNGPWSLSGTASQYVPTPMCTLTVNYTGSGSVSGGGSYDCGTSPASPVITAYPSTYYYFNGWSGSGCTGGGSNPVAITVTANITCTASFPIADITPAAPTVTYTSVSAIYTYFTFSTTCPGPNATPDYQYASYNGGTLLEGYYENGTTTNDNPRPITTMITSGTTYTFYVRVYCSNPVTSSGWVYGSTNYYKDYWWTGAGSQLTGKWIYYADSGSLQYKTSLTANASPQSSTSHSEPTWDSSHPTYSELVSPQIYTGVSFSAYPAQNACKALGGRLPNDGEVANMIDFDYTYGSLGFPPLGGADYVSAGETDYNTQHYALRDLSTNSFGESGKTTAHNVRCVHD